MGLHTASCMRTVSCLNLHVAGQQAILPALRLLEPWKKQCGGGSLDSCACLCAPLTKLSASQEVMGTGATPTKPSIVDVLKGAGHAAPALHLRLAMKGSAEEAHKAGIWARCSKAVAESV